MTEQIIQRAREMLVAQTIRSPCVERAILGGAWDNGSLIRELLPDAEIDLMRTPNELVEE